MRGRGRDEKVLSIQTLTSVSTRLESGREPAPMPPVQRCGRRSRCAGRSVGARPVALGSGQTASSRTGGGSSRRRVAGTGQKETTSQKKCNQVLTDGWTLLLLLWLLLLLLLHTFKLAFQPRCMATSPETCRELLNFPFEG